MTLDPRDPTVHPDPTVNPAELVPQVPMVWWVTVVQLEPRERRENKVSGDHRGHRVPRDPSVCQERMV